MSRSASIERNTSETKIKLSIDLDGNGNGNIHTGIGFFDHMLNAFARHGFFDLDVEVEGDLYVDCHHTIEDTVDRVGEFDTEMVKEFFYAVSYGSMMNLHLKKLHGENNHHMIEAAFKAFAKALDEATSLDSRITDVLSTKGAL